MPIRHVAIQAVDVLSRHAPDVHAPPAPRVCSSRFTQRRLLSWNTSLEPPLLTRHQPPSWCTFLQRLLHSSTGGVCFTRARREGPFSSCQRYTTPAPVVDNIAQFTHLTCLCVHFPCVCGAHSTGSRGVHQRLLGVVSRQRLQCVLLLCLSWCAFFHLQQFTLIMDTRLPRHVAIQVKTFSVCKSKRTRRAGRRSAELHLFEYVCF